MEINMERNKAKTVISSTDYDESKITGESGNFQLFWHPDIKGYNN
jgi:hypothetical protein